jgi:hypothetical protein
MSVERVTSQGKVRPRTDNEDTERGLRYSFTLSLTLLLGGNVDVRAPRHSILSTAPQLSISQKALGTLPEDGNVMSKHVGATIYS